MSLLWVYLATWFLGWSIRVFESCTLDSRGLGVVVFVLYLLFTSPAMSVINYS